VKRTNIAQATTWFPDEQSEVLVMSPEMAAVMIHDLAQELAQCGTSKLIIRLDDGRSLLLKVKHPSKPIA
jgi:hypothetical protein